MALEGVRETGPGTIRLVTSQAFVEGNPATAEEIAAFFQSHGYEAVHRTVQASGLQMIDWVHQETGLMIRDAHGDNILKTASGALAAIDLAVGRITS